jgi:hypothetical protein
MSTPVIDQSKKKFAVAIGINYYNTPNQLNGCINDVNHIKTFLVEKAKYLPENIMTLTDDANILKPTKQNIINSFNTLVNKAVNENFTELWLSYSGHGSYVNDLNGDEKDLRDEVMCPCDFDAAGMITDDFIYSNLIVKLPSTVTLFSLMDCCHSGTILDLPLIYNTSLTNNNTNKPVASVISISGCRDDQTSADAYITNKYEGAMTWSFLNALSQANYNIKTLDLVNNMRVLLKTSYTQVPLLAISSNVEFDRKFIQPTQTTQLPITNIPQINIKPINFKIKTDYWYTESSWNVWSVSENKYIFSTNNRFTQRFQEVNITKDLALGKYKLCAFDTYGDGGLTSTVNNGAITLVFAKMYLGKTAEYAFEVL